MLNVLVPLLAHSFRHSAMNKLWLSTVDGDDNFCMFTLPLSELKIDSNKAEIHIRCKNINVSTV